MSPSASLSAYGPGKQCALFWACQKVDDILPQLAFMGADLNQLEAQRW